MAWLLALFLAAPAPYAVVWGEGKSLVTQRAIEAWFALRDAGRLPPLAMPPGYPRAVPSLAVDAAPGLEAAILGVCEEVEALRLVAALQAANANVRAERLVGQRPSLACPSLGQVDADSVVTLRDTLRPDEATVADRQRHRIAPCSFDRAGRRARWGDDALCLSLWGVSCATYAGLMAYARVPEPDLCRFLLGTAPTSRLVAVDADRYTLTFCDDEDAAWVFASWRGEGGDRVPYPVEILCGQGADYATRLGALTAVGAGVCLEYLRTFEPAGLNAGLLCFTAQAAAPHGVADTLPLFDERGPGRYAVVEVNGEKIVCTDAAALRLTPAGLEPLQPRPAACAGATLRPPLPEVGP